MAAVGSAGALEVSAGALEVSAGALLSATGSPILRFSARSRVHVLPRSSTTSVGDHGCI